MNMKLDELVGNFVADTKVRVIEKDMVLYDGDAGTLNKILTGYVNKHSGQLVDGAFQLEVTEYKF